MPTKIFTAHARYLKFASICLVACIISASLAWTSQAQATESTSENTPPTTPNDLDKRQKALSDLGAMLYFDMDLSANRNQSCASCHNPAHGFADDRDNGVQAAASLGSDGQSLGDRNSPALGYARFSPSFHQNNKGEYRGGQFWDGRADDLKAQAGGPIMNPIEMALSDAQMLLSRLKEKRIYETKFTALFGRSILTDANATLEAVTEALAAFEQTVLFAPFDSKYDRYLKGEYKMSPMEDLGMTLFFSQQFTNCNQCHQLKARPAAEYETFSDYRYHNIGTPTNLALRAKNGLDPTTKDLGLLANPAVADPAQAGKFRTPSLRNIAVTGPYMHNGVFQELTTVIAFYNKYNSKSAKRQINPETGERWADPEVTENLALKDLQHGPALDNKRIKALVAFLKTLTDKRYEHLLK